MAIKVVMQGFPGCFHQEAAQQYFTGKVKLILQ